MIKDVQKQNELYEFLLDFGLSEREITLYLTLLKTGPNTIMNLSRETGIKRSTTHNNVEELIKKGLVSQTNYGERRMVIAEDPDKLQFLLEQKKYKMKKMEANLPGVVGAILNLVPNAKDKIKSEVKYYEGIDEIKYVYEQTVNAKEVYSFVNLEKYYEIFPEPIGLQEKALGQKRERKVYDIIVDSEVARKVVSKKYKNYLAKFIHPDKYFSGLDMIIFDEKVAIIQLDKENLTAVLIESITVSNSLKALHQTLWALLDD